MKHQFCPIRRRNLFSKQKCRVQSAPSGSEKKEKKSDKKALEKMSARDKWVKAGDQQILRQPRQETEKSHEAVF
jgi:hypothetical protein